MKILREIEAYLKSFDWGELILKKIKFGAIGSGLGTSHGSQAGRGTARFREFKGSPGWF